MYIICEKIIKEKVPILNWKNISKTKSSCFNKLINARKHLNLLDKINTKLKFFFFKKIKILEQLPKKTNQINYNKKLDMFKTLYQDMPLYNYISNAYIFNKHSFSFFSKLLALKFPNENINVCLNNIKILPPIKSYRNFFLRHRLEILLTYMRNFEKKI
nr:hypothetical protein 1634Bnrm1_p060 [Cryptomonas sp.]